MYGFIRGSAGAWPVHTLCAVLGVSRSAYYGWLSACGVVDKREEETERLVLEAFQDHRRRYGVRRLVAELKAQGLEIGAYKVRQVLQKHELKAIQPRSFVPRTTDSRHPYPISPNLLLELAFPTAPNQVWVGDITYIPLAGGGFLYLAVWMDLYSRRIVGWRLDAHMQEELVVEALRRALATRTVAPGMLVHSDRGGQYAGKAFRRLLDKHKTCQSMSRADNAYDNAFMESCFSRFKAELLEGGAFENKQDAQTEIFEYIEMYYNTRRRHSALGYLSPMHYEKKC
ncbi:IS3 family transposase [Pontibacter qinzhouensis]|uniref:IS3 family transposase n=1 Tax=Pontibacter qinzhouensis TaxID=2603253 RepID=A0A5C8KB50_9BACT|nr:IS3 family transposase [Pontibacter qinzhouensis]